MKQIHATLIATVLGLSSLPSCSDRDPVSTVAGTVRVNGAPIDSGTIHFQSNSSPKSSGGGAVTNGAFQIVSNHAFDAGEYSVVLQAFKKTGRKINDPQKGMVDESQPMDLTEPSQKVILSPDNAENLSLEFSASSK